MKFSVVTPCKNPGRLLRPTVESIVGQRAVLSGRAALEYFIIDGGSNDGSLASIDDIVDENTTIISEEDSGLYDALVKGFERADGDIHSYLNAGDLYSPTAFDVAMDLFESRGSVFWLTGMSVHHNSRGDIVTAQTPFRYRRELLRCGVYGRVLPFLQQEGTFWSSELTDCLDLERLREFRLAGDSFLWWNFAAHAEPTIVSAYLGGFRRHGGHLSADLHAYAREVESFSGNVQWAQWPKISIDKTVWRMPVGVKKLMNPRHLVVWSDEGWR